MLGEPGTHTNTHTTDFLCLCAPPFPLTYYAPHDTELRLVWVCVRATGRVSAQHGADGAGTQGQLASQEGLGEVHRCGHQHYQQEAKERRLYALGQAVTGMPLPLCPCALAALRHADASLPPFTLQKKAKNIDRSKHLVLECPHPSPLSASRGFFGCKHFSKANEYLKQHNKEPIDWSVPA